MIPVANLGFDILVPVEFRVSDYGPGVARPEVARLLESHGDGRNLMPLVMNGNANQPARAELSKWKARDLFPRARSPEGALAGLYAYFSCEDEAHRIAQDLNTPEGSFWHGIVHRREPDASNAAYWFRRVGPHAVFPKLRNEAHRLRFDTGAEWDPMEFIGFCEAARVRPGSHEETLATQVQLVEWQLLFDYCVRGIHD